MESGLTRTRPRSRRQFDAITEKRRALFEAGGIHVERFGNRGRMTPNAPEFRERAEAYNALADSHGPEPL